MTLLDMRQYLHMLQIHLDVKYPLTRIIFLTLKLKKLVVSTLDSILVMPIIDANMDAEVFIGFLMYT